jgi:hypothetical protein
MEDVRRRCQHRSMREGGCLICSAFVLWVFTLHARRMLLLRPQMSPHAFPLYCVVNATHVLGGGRAVELRLSLVVP